MNEILKWLLIAFCTVLQSYGFQDPSSWSFYFNQIISKREGDFYKELYTILSVVPTQEPFTPWNRTIDPINQYATDDWDNSLPTLVYHGGRQGCNTTMIARLIANIQDIAKAENNSLIDADCISVGDYDTKEFIIDGQVNMKEANELFSTSFTGLRWQADVYCEKIKKHAMFNNTDFNIVAISQGGNVARDMIQNCDLGPYKVRNFLTLGTPHLGQSRLPKYIWGDEGEDKNTFYTSLLNQVAYLQILQDVISAGGYWRATTSEFVFENYLAYSKFSSEINNEKRHEKSEQYKKRFGSLNRLCLTKFGHDAVLNPYETSQFGQINVGDTKVTPMREQRIYTEDLIGLKTLDEQNKIFFRTVSGACHTCWSMEWMVNEIFPCLYSSKYPQVQQMNKRSGE